MRIEITLFTERPSLYFWKKAVRITRTLEILPSMSIDKVMTQVRIIFHEHIPRDCNLTLQEAGGGRIIEETEQLFGPKQYPSDNWYTLCVH